MKDAKNLFHFLQRRGWIEGNAPELPPLIRDATPLTAVESIKAEVAGVIMFHRKAGDKIEEGDLIADVINPMEETSHQITAATSGILYAQRLECYARPDMVIARIAGKIPLQEEGNLLLAN